MTRYLQSLLLISGYLAILAYSALLPDNAPDKSEPGQAGTNKCGTQSSQSSMCQNSFLNSVDDFCLYAPPEPGPDSVIGNTERIEVAWCTKSNHGTRLIPPGAITGAHFIQTPDFVQVTGIGDLTKINIPKGDGGGELDPHGADGNGNPIGGLVFSSAFGQLEQILEWTNFVSDTEFCFRACKPGPNAARLCQHIYDVMGCFWNMPGNYDTGFSTCQADTGEPMGVYGSSTFFQGQPSTPPPHPAPSSSKCGSTSTIGDVALPTSTSSTTPTGGSSSQVSSAGAAATSASTTTGSAAPAKTSDNGALGSIDGTNRLVITFGVCLALGATFLL
jgi:hypothetical protein